MIFTDASNHAYGGFISNSITTKAYGMWSEQEQGQSSTFRELKAIHNVIESYAPLLAHSEVKLFSDNQGACTVVDKGSPKLILNQLAIDIFVLAFLWLTSHPRSTVVPLDTGTPGMSRKIFSEDADGDTRTPSVINRVLWSLS